MAIAKRGIVLGATAFVLSAVAVTGVGIHLSPQGQAFLRPSPKELVDEVWQVIDKRYVDSTFNQQDWTAVRKDYLDRKYEKNEDAYEAIREMLEKLEDPYTRFMDPEEFQNMKIDTSGELTGVGIQLAQDEETKKLVVVSPIEDTPAFRAGIQSKDVISKIDGQTTKGMDINEAVRLIRGKPGSQVTLTILRGEEGKDRKEMDFTITRARIEIHPVRYSKRSSPEGQIGYIRLTQFSAIAAQEMRDAIRDLEKQKVTGYVLDLRSNPGGLLDASIDIARMWLDRGTIVSTVNRLGTSDLREARGNALTEKPLVVLVDGGSASASEILSGALQDHKRAKIVGTKTFGKGLVQSVQPLSGGAGLAVTIAKYLTPDGRDINKAGIEPDIAVPLTEKDKERFTEDRTRIGTMEDPQFAKAVEILGQEIKAQRGQHALSSP